MDMTASQNGARVDEDISQWPTGRLLSAAARRVEREWDAHLDAWQLSHASFPVLFLLSRSDHSQRELAGAMSVTEQTMSRLCARLERAGYVQRTPAPGDRRRHVVSLRPAGAAVLAQAADPGPVEAMTTRFLSDAQVAALRDALVTMLTEANGSQDASGASEDPSGAARRPTAPSRKD